LTRGPRKVALETERDVATQVLAGCARRPGRFWAALEVGTDPLNCDMSINRSSRHALRDEDGSLRALTGLAS
jgi:hypothetical protein